MTEYIKKIVVGDIDNYADFLKLCTKEFGYKNNKEDSLDAPLLVTFVVSDFTKSQLDNAKHVQTMFLSATVEECTDIMRNELRETEHKQMEIISECKEREQKLEKILIELNEFKFTVNYYCDLSKLVTFAKSQITDELNRLKDSKLDAERVLALPKKSSSNWKNDKLNSLQEDVNYWVKKSNIETEIVQEKQYFVTGLLEAIEENKVFKSAIDLLLELDNIYDVNDLDTKKDLLISFAYKYDFIDFVESLDYAFKPEITNSLKRMILNDSIIRLEKYLRSKIDKEAKSM